MKIIFAFVFATFTLNCFAASPPFNPFSRNKSGSSGSGGFSSTNVNLSQFSTNNGTLSIKDGASVSNITSYGTLSAGSISANGIVSAAGFQTDGAIEQDTGTGMAVLGATTIGSTLDVQAAGTFWGQLTSTNGKFILGAGNGGLVISNQGTATSFTTSNSNASQITQTTLGVGIGTNAPTAKLHVHNTPGSSNTITIFGTNATGNGLTVSSNGTVGIGTNSPASTLSVLGTFEVGAAPAGTAVYIGPGSGDRTFIGSASSGSSGSRIWFAGNKINFERSDGAFNGYYHSSEGRLHAASSITTSGFVVTNSGTVGIGTTTPAAKLQVVGSFSAGVSNAILTNVIFLRTNLNFPDTAATTMSAIPVLSLGTGQTNGIVSVGFPWTIVGGENCTFFGFVSNTTVFAAIRNHNTVNSINLGAADVEVKVELHQ